MHLGITGTRKGITQAQFDVFHKMIEEDSCISHLHQGDCMGADYNLTCMFLMMHYARIVRHPPINRGTQANGEFHETRERKTYLERDKDIVNESDYLWAAPKGEEIVRSGTWTTVRYARKKGIPITIVMPNGDIIYE